jgi:ribosomal protein S18 acetylase RimI-like enzyme
VAAEGGRAVRLVVTEDNPKAIRFWQRMGFQVEGAGTQVRGSKESVFLRMSHALAPAPGLLRRLAAAFRRAP